MHLMPFVPNDSPTPDCSPSGAVLGCLMLVSLVTGSYLVLLFLMYHIHLFLVISNALRI